MCQILREKKKDNLFKKSCSLEFFSTVNVRTMLRPALDNSELNLEDLIILLNTSRIKSLFPTIFQRLSIRLLKKLLL